MWKRSRRSRRRAGLLLVGVLLICNACEGGGPPPDYTPEELDAAKAELRDHRRLQTFEAGKLFGDEWVARAPHDAELRALYAYQLVGWGLSKEVHEQADAILADDPENPWGLYTKAYAHLVDREAELAYQAVQKAWEASPRPEFAFLYLRALMRVDFEAAREFLESLDEEARGRPEVLRMEAEIEDLARYELEDPTWADSMRATWAEFKERFPDHVLGYTRLANEAYNDRRMDDWTSLMEAALELAPGSAEVRGQHWRGLWMSDFLPREERRPAVEASMAAYREASPETVEGLYSMASVYREMGDEERAGELEAQIVERDPAGYHASGVYLAEMRAARDKLYEIGEEYGHSADSPEYRAQLEVVRDAVHDYLAKPLYSDTYKGGAYLNLFGALRVMDPVPAEELADAIRGLAEHERLNPHITFGHAPLAMIDHTPYALEAADIVREGAPHIFESLKEVRRFYDTEGEYDQALRATLSGIYDVIGWAHFKAGRTEDGRHTLERALAIAETNRDVRYHLGQVYEQLAVEDDGDAEAVTMWLDRAEDSYIAGFGASRGENPNEAALEALYERRTGSREGIEEYLATLDERDRTRRHERILESRMEAPEAYETFALARLDGEMVNSADLEGKIMVLHFWGTWCGPCVVEMPEYQEFDERYREDPEVHVLSISNDDTNEIIEDFLAKNDFDFTVLVDDGYTERAGVTAWPTTWFVDRNGYVRFEKTGTALRLDEEFSWRVEALREDADSH